MTATNPILLRRSVRDFDKREVPLELLHTILTEAGRAPSWVNAQEWRAYVISKETLKGYRQAYAARAASGDQGAPDYPVTHRETWSQRAQQNMAQTGALMEQSGVMAELQRSQTLLFNAPALVFLTQPKTANKYAIFDLGAFAQTLMLSAASHGVDSVVAYNITKYPDLVRKTVPVPEDYAVVVGIALGYRSAAAVNSFSAPRMALDDYATFLS